MVALCTKIKQECQNVFFSLTTGSHTKPNHAARPLLTTNTKRLHEVPKGIELKLTKSTVATNNLGLTKARQK